MPVLKTIKEVADYPSLDFFPKDTPSYFSFSVDFNHTPRQHHVVLTFYPQVKNGKPSGEDQHWHVPMTKRNARDLRKWLTRYLGE